METWDKGRFHSPFAATEGSSMSGTIGANWRHAPRRQTGLSGAPRSGLPLFVAVPLALLLTGAIVTVTAFLVERLG